MAKQGQSRSRTDYGVLAVLRTTTQSSDLSSEKAIPLERLKDGISVANNAQCVKIFELNCHLAIYVT
jgi:hypothetical protein